MRTLTILMLALIFILIILGVVAAVFFQLFSKGGEALSGGIDIEKINRTEIGKEQVAFMLYNLKAYELHNVPLSKNTPKIELVVGEKIYSGEIVRGNINVFDTKIENPDLRISMSSEEFINALNSNMNLYLQQSVEEGKTRIEVIAGKVELLAKGYLSLYKEITGKDLSGDVFKYLKD